jgi:hypothetical protein
MTETFFGRLKWIETGALALGLLMLVGASQFEWPWLYTTCMLAFGLGLSLSGLGAFTTRRVRVLEFFREGSPYLGPAAVPWGFAVFVLGVSLFGIGLLRTFGLDASFLEYLKQHPAAGLVVAALLLGGLGTGMALGPPDWNTSVWQALLHIPLRFLGVLVVLAGLSCLFLGGFEAIAPAAFDTWLQQVLGPFAP